MPYVYPGGDELTYMRFLEAERIGLTAQACMYYTLSRGRNVDPLYNEPDPNWYFDEFPMEFSILFQEMDNKDVSVRDEGENIEWDGECFVSHNEWFTKGPPTMYGVERLPKAGDVINIMAHYFDVVKGASGGNEIDQIPTVGFKLLLKARSKFDAVRKMPTP